MTSKEALNKLCISCDNELLYEQSGIIFINELINIIEKDLERLEQLEDNIKIHKETIKMQHSQIEKLEKVIAILKSKGVQEDFLKHTKNVNDYNKAIKHLNYFDELTQEEYELLKEY